MKIAYSLLVASVVAIASPTSMAVAQTTDAHKVVSAQDIKWAAGPGSIPPGAQVAVLFGDPSKDGMFAMRLKLPKDYSIAPHTHPKPEVVTVISGALRLGMGETADKSKGERLSAGSFFALSPGMAHYVFVDEDTVLQLNSNGPWNLNYINPKDDPRQNKQ
jgi:quercetin dioxygenase-like cupin family protein